MKNNPIYPLLILFFFLFLIQKSHSQNECGTSFSKEEFATFLNLRQEMDEEKNTSRKNDSFVLRFILVNNNLNTLNVSKNDVSNVFIDLKRDFDKAGIFFQPCYLLDNIVNNKLYELDKTTEAQELSNLATENIINIFIVKSISSSIGSLCGYATLPYSSGKKLIALASQCALNGSTISHEMGHIFGLPHTHEIKNGAEYVDRLNCSTAGDGFCDTPADPVLGTNNVNNCNYIGYEIDLFGKYYNPDVKNLMSYAPKICRDRFSKSQTVFMQQIAKDYYSNMQQKCYTNELSITTNFTIPNLLGGETLNIPFDLKLEKVSEQFVYQVDLTLTDANGGIVTSTSREYNTSIGNHNDALTLEIPNKLYTGLYNILLKINYNVGIKETNVNNNYVNIPFEVEYKRFRPETIFYNSDTKNVFIYNKTIGLGDVKIKAYDASGKLLLAYNDKQETTGEYINTVAINANLKGLIIFTFEYDGQISSRKIFVP
jgi:hypothetical protein